MFYSQLIDEAKNPPLIAKSFLNISKSKSETPCKTDSQESVWLQQASEIVISLSPAGFA